MSAAVEEGARLGCHHCQGVVAYCYFEGYGCKAAHVLSLSLARESSGSSRAFQSRAPHLFLRNRVISPRTPPSHLPLTPAPSPFSNDVRAAFPTVAGQTSDAEAKQLHAQGDGAWVDCYKQQASLL